MNNRRSLYGRFALAALGFVVAHVGVGLLVERLYPDQSLLNMSLIAFAQGAFSLMVAFVILTWQATVLWREGKMLYDHGLAIGEGVGGRRRVKRSVLAFLRPRLQAHLEEAQKLFGAGLPISKDELGELISSAFSSCKGAYIGTDRNVPSEFFRLYPFYIRWQAEGRDTSDDVRFVMATIPALQADYGVHQNHFREFVTEHRNRGIELLQVDPEHAETAVAARLSAEEIGIYGKDYVIFFSHTTNEHFVISISLLDRKHQSTNDTLRDAILWYLEHLNAHSREIMFGERGQLVFRQREAHEITRRAQRIRAALHGRAIAGGDDAS